MIEVIPVRVSLVVPVYQGEKSLPRLINEVVPFISCQLTPSGIPYLLCEVILVHDCGPDRSDLIMEELGAKYQFIRQVWLSRNFGQHPATMAGMASSSGDWVVTIDEDGQQDPSDIGRMLDCAMKESLQVVYAQPLNLPFHGWLRNKLSQAAKAIAAKLIGNSSAANFNSFRMIDGEVARTLAAYSGNGIYLDVALFWIAARIGYCQVRLRNEDRPSGYSYSKLIAHFWRLILTTGTRPLRLITILGFISLFLAMATSFFAFYGKFISNTPVQGWTSLLIVTSVFSGSIMVSIGVVAEYLAIIMSIAMGKPLYVVSSKPTRPYHTK